MIYELFFTIILVYRSTVATVATSKYNKWWSQGNQWRCGNSENAILSIFYPDDFI